MTQKTKTILEWSWAVIGFILFLCLWFYLYRNYELFRELWLTFSIWDH